MILAAARTLQSAGVARTCPWLLRRTFGTVDSSASETHDDFKPKYKQEPISDVASKIKQDVESNTVFVFMKGVPEAPKCGFSNMACRILDAYGVKYGAADVLADPALREGIKKYTNWPTIPQVFVKSEFIGGADILYNMHESGDLGKLLEPIIEGQRKAAK
mmetsp:Transcript_26836/g.58532  ORF Transcript_26836/g.58532 Transcript_26836/m.58532 type:complete len:161 (+) Transcript_26836:71-553(+)|eukprot:CAMPEP_0202900762 /NCGR_PEP_ID=MMETSP1392-20130828/12019_1 /ASSEMBLY_ACC=CAM_ASM_000868 /TAXON_ID=225041 /ORGANISM="Chlamydomonas chlamydogama, Strain SAG 11-48b" /LENGTH=160 /DNA_ID=CAMNT_0049587201 /DNA_START=72 /DNA_END=554 /DNA_ORIENTATION=-